MNRKQKRMVRLLAIVLAVLLGAGAVFSAIFSLAYAEEATSASNNQCELTMEYLGEEQALRMSQRLVYTNTSGKKLDRVVFYAPANLFRRQDSLTYDAADLEKVFPAGYLPGGIELVSVLADGESADYGFQGADEAFLRVACDLQPGESCTFIFNYYLLLTENAAFLGVSKNDWHLSGFYFSPASTDANGEFILNTPLFFTRYVDTPGMDFSAEITLPEGCLIASGGTESSAPAENGAVRWSIRADGAHDLALVFSANFREYAAETVSGVQLRCLTSLKGKADAVLAAAETAVETCEKLLGPLPFRQIDIVQADYGAGPLNHTACLWLPEESIKAGGQELMLAVYTGIAQQYFGCSAWARPVSDAWLSDAVSETVGYLLLEETQGYESYITALNKNIVSSLQLTIPGGLNVASDAALFTAYEYDIVVRDRGAAVFHELYTAMGRENLAAALRIFHEKGLEKDVLTEMDLVDALDEASGKSWEKFLTDWVFNIGDYVNQDIGWLE